MSDKNLITIYQAMDVVREHLNENVRPLDICKFSCLLIHDGVTYLVYVELKNGSNKAYEVNAMTGTLGFCDRPKDKWQWR